jgi:hypothetical protein
MSMRREALLQQTDLLTADLAKARLWCEALLVMKASPAVAR